MGLERETFSLLCPWSNGVALRLTVAEHYLPPGRFINCSDNKNVKKGII
ncbi:hypothetical protein AGMMS49573_02380 [Endomicrobiia bacterium]|nr:hypothetical protein [Candidatus Endomicrobium trichonymphae]GHT05982.1 hypothetical protein AGMMS49523_06530 [Endomicrobiia bacterium]GHT08704.1 hypothetical protein AGMMS49532_04490 [Endomicrobiia bacterium]GHT11875.1 hypothetical protein AGMMS49571_02920 [Endomicrobiia bacterium]GHT15575.1 hypothetical protein AGMMS49573_02380 [Endomicrobiia bacterium]GHT19716.1 hypothetical protein AGMMS49929_04100 [Endomicrobiia bacterium]